MRTIKFRQGNPGVSKLSPSIGRLEQAKRFALSDFDKWNDVTGFVAPHTSYYYELQSCLEDAVEYGFGVAHGQTFKEIRKHIKKGKTECQMNQSV